MKSVIERSWITAVFSTFGAVGLIGLLFRELLEIELNLNVPLAAMMIVSGIYGLIATYLLQTGKAERGAEWGNNPWSNLCFGIGLFALGALLLLQDIVNPASFVILGLCSLLFVIGFFIEGYYTKTAQ